MLNTFISNSKTIETNKKNHHHVNCICDFDEKQSLEKINDSNLNKNKKENYNNGFSRRLAVSAEGITANGQPIMNGK